MGGGGGSRGVGGGYWPYKLYNLPEFVTDNCTCCKLYNLWVTFTNSIQIVNSQLIILSIKKTNL